MIEAHSDHGHNEPDERLALLVEQGVLLWCMRMLVDEMKRGVSVEEPVGEMLAAIGANAASAGLKDFMSALSRGCTRMIDVRCLCRKRISLDERALLDVLSLMQSQRPFEARLVLRGFVTEDGAESALSDAERVGSALTRAGRFLPEPEQEVRQIALSSAGRLVHRTDTTVH